MSWTEHRTNESILEETGYRRELLATIKKRKMTYLGHIMRKDGDNLEKMIIQAAVPGKRGRGRPRKSWLDDVIEWTGLSVEELLKKPGIEKLTEGLSEEQPTLENEEGLR